VFLVDATVTLFHRWVRGERLSQAHRSHAYQHAARRFGGHLPVVLGMIAINLLWLLPWAWVAQAWPRWSMVAVVAALGPLVVLAWRLGAGRAEARA
jgi:Fuc2NAc and GlcNAc transferase